MFLLETENKFNIFFQAMVLIDWFRIEINNYNFGVSYFLELVNKNIVT